MDLSKIMNIQDGFLANKADLLFNYEPTNSATPNTVRRQKIQTSLLSNCKIWVNENKRPSNRL